MDGALRADGRRDIGPRDDYFLRQAYAPRRADDSATRFGREHDAGRAPPL